MGRDIKLRKEYRVSIEKGKHDYSRLLDDEDLREDVICSECGSEKELVLSPYWGARRRYYTCYFICPKCEARR